MAKREHTLEAFLASVEGRAFAMARYATRNEDDAMEMVQEAMTKFVARYAKKPEAEWKPLFYRSLKNLLIDWGRRESFRSRFRGFFGLSRTNAEAEEPEGPDPIQSAPDLCGLTPEQTASDGDFMRDLRRALEKLSPRQRQVFFLRAWEELSVAETATAMECSEGAVKTHYFRSLEALRGELGERWP